jgi:hypothetical protein
MFDQIQTWWQSWTENTTPETRALIQQAGLAVAALLGGHIFGSIVARFLRSRNFDAALRLSDPPSDAEGRSGFTPTFVASMLVRVTVWAAAGSWIARQQGWVELAGTLGLVISRSWALAAVLVGALALSALVVRRLMDCFQGLPGAAAATAPARNGAAGSPRGVAGALAAGVYGLVLLLALLVTADLFDWPLTRNSAQALWQLAQHLLVAGAALLIGGLGARWARDLVTADTTTSPEKLAGQYTALGIVATSTVLAVAVLLSSAGLLFALAALALLGGGLWLARRQLPDVAAGLELRAHKVSEVELEGAPWQVAHVGLVESDVCRGGAFHRLQNRLVLDARMHGERAGAAAR